MATSLAAILVLCLCLFFYGLGDRDFWAPDEGDFGQIVRELDSDLLVPHLNGTAYGEKPPLFYYLTYLSRNIFHSVREETAMRIATSSMALLAALLLVGTLRQLFLPKQAFLATLMAITSPLYYWQARYLQVDMVFSGFVVAALLFFILYCKNGKASTLYCCSACTALAFMTKGPLAIVLVVPVAFIHLIAGKKLKIVKLKDLLVCTIIFLAIALPWYLAIYAKEGYPYLYENVVRQNFVRFFDAWSHKRPIYYYLTTLPLDFFPWSLFLPVGIYLAIKGWKTDDTARFFLIWAGWMFLFFSLSSGKISKYMLPAIPALSAIVSYAASGAKNRYCSIMVPVTGALLVMVAIALLIIKTGLYPEFHSERIFLAVLSVMVAAILFYHSRRKDMAPSFYVIIGFMCLAYLMANTTVYAKWNPYKSPKALGEKIASYIATGTPWVYYGSIRGVYIYYAGKHAVHVDEHKTSDLAMTAKHTPRFYILTRKRDMVEVLETLGSVKTVFEEKIGGTVMVFALYDDTRGIIAP